MFEDDVILPDESQETGLPQSDETNDISLESELDTNPTETEETNQDTQEEIQPFLKVKYNKEDMDLDEERARELAQKGLNYDKLQERLQAFESDPRLTFVEELANEQGMDVNDFLTAVQEAREQEKLNQLIQQNIPEELAQEILQSRKDREERKKIESQKEIESQQQAEALEFFDYFREINGRDYVPNSKEDVPDEVFEIQKEQGIPLKYAYMQHLNQQLQNQIKVLKQNEENSKRAPIGGTTQHGSTETASEDDFLRGFNSIN